MRLTRATLTLTTAAALAMALLSAGSPASAGTTPTRASEAGPNGRSPGLAAAPRGTAARCGWPARCGTAASCRRRACPGARAPCPPAPGWQLPAVVQAAQE